MLETINNDKEDKDEKMLNILLVHWINHNKSHVEGYREWIDKAKEMDKTETSKYIEKAIEALKASHKAQDVEKIDKDMEALSAALQKAGEEIYKAQAAQQQPQGDTSSASSSSAKEGDNIQDVDFEEVK